MLEKNSLADIGKDLLFPDTNPLNNLLNNGAEVTDKGDYIVIKINNPGDISFVKDRAGSNNPLIDNDNNGKVSKGDIVEIAGIDAKVGAEIVINGPLFGTDNNPVGGFIENGELKKPFIDPKVGGGNFANTNGVIGQRKNGEFFLLTYDEWQNKSFNNTDFSWVMQNGPIVIIDGKVPHNKGTNPREISRTALGYNDAGEMIIVYTKSEAPTNMHKLGEYMNIEGAKNAIFLDGANVGFINDLAMIGNIVDGSTTLSISQKPVGKRR